MRSWSAHLYPFANHPNGAPAREDLQALAAAGYSSVEAFPRQIATCSNELRDCRLQVSALHVTTDDVASHLAALIQQAHTWQATTLVVSGPLGWSNRSPENWERSIDLLTRAAYTCAAEDLTICYHNHAFEFRADDTGWKAADLLIPALAKSSVRWCLDLGWIDRAQENPVAVVEIIGTALHTVHFRDFAPDGTSCALGTGTVAVTDCLNACAQATSIVHRVVEADPLPRARELLLLSKTFLSHHSA